MKTYAGIGSRETPADIKWLMTQVAKGLSANYTLRSGGADGADAAFEIGANRAEIYLPWKGFNHHPSSLYNITPAAFELAKQVHPAWNRLTPGAMKLHARNCYQILGAELDNPVRFVICWTPDGACQPRELSRATGGTATAIRLACLRHISIFNLQRDDHRNSLIQFTTNGGDLI